MDIFKRILVVMAHPDDEVLGCGGTIKKFTQAGRQVDILIMSSGVFGRRTATREELEQRLKSAGQVQAFLGASSLKVLDYPDNQFDTVPLWRVVQDIEQSIASLKPDLIITHSTADLNQDHEVVHKAVMVAARPVPGQTVKAVWQGEILSTTGWYGRSSAHAFEPDVFVDISQTLEAKLQAMELYKAELREFPHARSLKSIEALAVSRGASVGLAAAEAFMSSRLIIA